ncbi:MAG TPA: lipoyl synthase [Candidatus Krumholzibacteria bacterium]|nr:lipoyl synthase [Candidatus Krumholzibacteria bacterium]
MPRESLKERIAKRPPWLRLRLRDSEAVKGVSTMMRSLHLTTVCEEAQCPNLFECWSAKTATFMLMGEVCTRHCGFCAVKKGDTALLDPQEPEHVAQAVKELALGHAVVTSVNRDDLRDGGAAHFAATISAIRRLNPVCTVEVLIPDFGGSEEALATVLSARPEILNHNVETIPRLYSRVRHGSDFQRSLQLLARAAKTKGDKILRTKSGLMLGLGERTEEVFEVCERLREAEVDILTIGQYLQPSARHLPVERWVPPQEFEQIGAHAETLGFAHVESGVFVRSSYHAERHLPVDQEL